MEAMENKKIGRYEVLGELGRGAMGVVYKGRDPAIDRIVAIKTIKLPKKTTEKLDEKASVEQLYQEARIAGKLSHPNITAIFDIGEENGVHYIVIEHIVGVTLERVINENRKLTTIEKVNILTLVASALHYAHQRGVVHRDIKPANIMLLDDHQIKIMDFGISKFMSQEEIPTTQPGLIFGTPFYMSPEQISGQDLNRQTDIFSLGVMGYEFLTGLKPFLAENLAALLKKILSAEPAPPQALNKEVPKSVSNVILKALQKDKSKRYLDASEVVDDFELFINQTEMGRTRDVQVPKESEKKNLINSLRENYPFFSNFTEKDLKQIFSISRKKIYHSGEIIFKENTVGNKLYIVMAGQIEITKRFDDGDETVLNTLSAGDCFGEMAIVDSSPRFATAKAKSEAILIAINEVILRNSEPLLCLKLYKNLSSILADKLKKSDIRVNTLDKKLKEMSQEVQ